MGRSAPPVGTGPGISYSDIENEFANAPGDAKMRISVHTGRVTTKTHGIIARTRRWLFGATKEDRANNRKIMGEVLAGLKERYGEKIGVAAFLRAVPSATFKADGTLDRIPDEKPLEAREFQEAQWFGAMAKTQATTGAKNLVSGLTDTSKGVDGLAKGLVSLASVSGTARQQAVKDGSWIARQGPIERARSAPPNQRQQLWNQLETTTQTRYDNAVKLLKAAKAAQPSAPDVDLFGAAADLLRELGRNAQMSAPDVEKLISDIGAGRVQPSEDEADEIASLQNQLQHQLQNQPQNQQNAPQSV